MRLLDNFTDAADQLMTVPLADGSSVKLEFFYRPGIQRWTVDITHPLLTMGGFNLSLGPNILRQWRRLIPFGIAVTSNNGLDPMNAEDFQNGTCSVYILSADEVQQVEDEILAPIPLVNA